VNADITTETRLFPK